MGGRNKYTVYDTEENEILAENVTKAQIRKYIRCKSAQPIRIHGNGDKNQGKIFSSCIRRGYYHSGWWIC